MALKDLLIKFFRASGEAILGTLKYFSEGFLLNLGFPNIYQALSYFDGFRPQKDYYYDDDGIFLVAFYD